MIKKILILFITAIFVLSGCYHKKVITVPDISDVSLLDDQSLMNLAESSAANSKVTGLTELATTPEGTDIIYIVDDPGGSPISKKITIANLFGYTPATAWDDIGNPDAASNIDFGTYVTSLEVDDFRVGDITGSNYVKFSDTGMTFHGTYTLSTAFTTLTIPNDTSDLTLSNVGEIGLQATDDQFCIHGGASGEVQGEAAISILKHITMSFDPKAVCDGDVDRLFIMTVGDDAPEGFKIVEWKVSFEADPTTEADLDLKYADAFIGVANAAVIDVLDTTAGVSSEDINANINSGNAVANGKGIYLEFGTAYTETGHQIIFEMWGYAEED